MSQKLFAFIFHKHVTEELHRQMIDAKFLNIWFGLQRFSNSNWTKSNYWNYEGAWLLAIDGELVDYQIDSLNLVMRDTGLHFKRQDIRNMLENEANIARTNSSESRLYGIFDYIPLTLHLEIPTIKRITSNT